MDGDANFGGNVVGKGKSNSIKGGLGVGGSATFAGDVIVTGDVFIESGGSFKVFYGGSKNIVIADYVFDKGYKLLPLDELEAYIAKEGHLPNMSSQAELDASGVGSGVLVKGGTDYKKSDVRVSRSESQPTQQHSSPVALSRTTSHRMVSTS